MSRFRRRSKCIKVEPTIKQDIKVESMSYKLNDNNTSNIFTIELSKNINVDVFWDIINNSIKNI
jgi:hypothetical protein